MNVALVVLHLDCPTVSEETPTPPKFMLTYGAGSIRAQCPGCGQRLIIDIMPVDAPAPAEVAT